MRVVEDADPYISHQYSGERVGAASPTPRYLYYTKPAVKFQTHIHQKKWRSENLNAFQYPSDKVGFHNFVQSTKHRSDGVGTSHGVAVHHFVQSTKHHFAICRRQIAIELHRKVQLHEPKARFSPSLLRSKYFTLQLPQVFVVAYLDNVDINVLKSPFAGIDKVILTVAHI